MKTRAIKSSLDKSYFKSLDDEMELSEKIVMLLDGRALTIKQIKEELKRTKNATEVSSEEIETSIYLSFRIKSIPGLDNLKLYFLEDQEIIALKTIKQYECKAKEEEVIQQGKTDGHELAKRVSSEKSDFESLEEEMVLSEKTVPPQYNRALTNEQIKEELQKTPNIAKACVLCGRDCHEIFHMTYKLNTICGDCIEDLKEVIRVRQIGDVISMKEVKLKEQIADLKAKLKDEHEGDSTSTLVKEPNSAKAELKTEIFYFKILPVLMNMRSIYKSNLFQHEELIDTVRTVFPVVYEEIFQESFPASSKINENVSIHGIDADIVIYDKKTKNKPVKVFDFELPFPPDPILRKKREEYLRQKIESFTSMIWATDIAVVTFEEDDTIARICEEEAVQYFCIKALLAKMADLFLYFAKLNEAWKGREKLTEWK